MADCVICAFAFNGTNHAHTVVRYKADENTCRECYEGRLVTTFQNSVLAFFSNATEDPWHFKSPQNIPMEIKELVYKSNNEQVLGTREWDVIQWMYFSVRAAYHGLVALCVEVALQGGIWFHETFLDGENGRDYTKDFREGNVSHRLTPLFIEYWGMGYTPVLKPTVEGRVFNWIYSGARSLLHI
ncbi:MAG: hypothetical protein KDK64_00360 [Chlamydiia bacterium]|nr:hypothetical protein [Chlamydiia bacterium]